MNKTLLALALVSTTTLAANPTLVEVNSCHTHAGSGTYCIDLSLDVPDVEPRIGTHRLIFTWDQEVQAGSAAILAGTGTILSTDTYGSSVQVLFTAPDKQYITIGVKTAGHANSDKYDPVTLGLLAGDVDNDGCVTAEDRLLVNANVTKYASRYTFRSDVNANGVVTVADVGITNSKIGNVLP